jgi:hypothetical protein
MKTNRLIVQSLLLVALPVVAVSSYRAGAVAAKKNEPMFFELRKYVTPPGKMDSLKIRFKEHTTKAFERHGMKQVGYWQAVSGENAENTLVYLLAYPSHEARETSWKSFNEDAAWKKAKAESEKDGKLVEKVESTFLTATDFSAIK